jgi:hypothetical protein
MFSALVVIAALAAQPIELKYEGPLKDALKSIAEKGNLNVVVQGTLTERVQVNLSDISAEEALSSLAKVYRFELTHEGKLWVVREATTSADAVAPVAPMPPLPPMPALPGMTNGSADALREAAEKAREAAEEARGRAQQVRDEAQERLEAQREAAEAAKDMARAQAEERRARAEAGQDVVTAGGPLTVGEGTHVDSAVAYGGPVVIEPNAVVDGDAVAFGGDVILKEHTLVRGDAVSFGGRVVRAPSAQVKGEEVSMGGTGLGAGLANRAVKLKIDHDDDEARAEKSDEERHGFSLATFLLQYAVCFGLGFLLMMFAPGRMKQLEATIREQPVINGLTGLLGFVAFIPLCLLVALTIVGIPVAVLMVMAFVMLLPVCAAAVANAVGASLPTGKLRKTQALVLAVGLAVLLLVWRVPYLGPFTVVMAELVALGAIIRTRFGQPPHGSPIQDTVPFGQMMT